VGNSSTIFPIFLERRRSSPAPRTNAIRIAIDRADRYTRRGGSIVRSFRRFPVLSVVAGARRFALRALPVV
jgi:hypothetical protein